MVIVGGRYRLVERLGVGGMSLVWRAFDEVLGRQVAIKVLDGPFAGDPAFRRAIRREARAVARLSHPNIGVVYDYGESPDSAGVATPYVVMELIDGPTLSERVRAGTLPWRSAVGICAQVAAALSAAHARGLVHRDVKPANIMLAGTGVKVVDFGISALVGEHVDQSDDGIVQGTPGYVAPERLLGAPVGAAADVYALGVVLFQALAGRLPFDAVGETEILAAHLTAQPEPLPRVPGMPDSVNDLYLRCLAKDPGQRPGAREVTAALSTAGRLTVDTMGERGETVAGGDPGPDGEPTTLLPSADTAPIAVRGRARVAARADGGTRPMRPHRPRRIAALAVLLLALVGGVGYAATTGDGDANPMTSSAAGSDGPPCAVTYRLSADDGATFSGTLSIRVPPSPPPAGGWTLSFDLPANQKFRAASPAAFTQDGNHVMVHIAGSGALGGDTPVVVPFTGSYQGVNPMPAAFVASGQSCTPLLLGPNGRPVASPSSTPDAPPATGNDDHGRANPAPPADGPAVGPKPGDGPDPADGPKPGNGPKPGGPKPGKGKGKGDQA
jgi:serine/threonine-protein kinase